MSNPFRYFNSSPEVIRLVVMMSVRYPLSLRNVEDLLAERGIDISHETVRFWWNRFGPMFAAEIRKRRVAHYSDKASGKSMAGRPELARALDDLATGDELVIAEWDRATRSMWVAVSAVAAGVSAALPWRCRLRRIPRKGALG